VTVKTFESPPVLAAVRVLQIDRVTAGVVVSLGRAGVPSILLKGPSVALWLYPGGAGRPYVDSDLLVPIDRWPAAERTLTEQGFANMQAGASVDEQTPHASPWRRSRDGACVDLHRTIAGVGVTPGEAWRVLAAQTASMWVGGAETPVLNEEARAVHVALHAAHNGIANQQSLRDLDLALDRVPEEGWRRAAVLAQRLAAGPSFAAGLRLLPKGQALAGRLRLSAQDSVEVRLRAISAPPLALGFGTLVERRGARAKLRYLGENLVPSPAFMRSWSTLASRGPFGLAVAYVIRWLWLASHAPTGYLAWRRTARGRTD
jgi:hypothetical protein